MKYAQIVEQGRIVLGPVTLTEKQVLDFACQYDTQWFHTDPQRAAHGPFQGLIASGWHGCVVAMRLVSEHILEGSESYASPGLDKVRWPHPVRPGDTLTLAVSVLSSRRSESKPWLRVLRWQWSMRNQHQAEVLSLEATCLFRLDPCDPCAPHAGAPLQPASSGDMS